MNDINNKNNVVIGVIISSIILVVFFAASGILEVNKFSELKCILNNQGYLIILPIPAFIFFYGLYILYHDLLHKPKKETLYLKEAYDEKTVKFMDKKGRKYNFHNNNYKENTFYIVKKTKYTIHKVIGISSETFEIDNATLVVFFI